MSVRSGSDCGCLIPVAGSIVVRIQLQHKHKRNRSTLALCEYNRARFISSQANNHQQCDGTDLLLRIYAFNYSHVKANEPRLSIPQLE